MRLFRLLVLVVLPLVFGCASIDVEKIPHPPSYKLADACSSDENAPCWNELQRQGDEIHGVRYYLPRPYVVVKQEYPVAGGTYFVPGTINRDGQVINLDFIPPELRDVFAGTVSLADVREGRAGFTDEEDDGTDGQQADDAPAKDAKDKDTDDTKDGAGEKEVEKKPEPKLLVDPDKLLEGSTVKPALVPSKESNIQLTAKVKKTAFEEGKIGTGTVLGSKLYLIPVREGKHVTEGLVEISSLVVLGEPGQDRTLTGQVAGKDVPAHASLGVGFKTEEQDLLIVHTASPDVHSTFASAPKKEEPKEEKKDGADKVVSEAKATVSGDPTTDPLTKISPLFDVLLLPDFSEQYAIQVKSGVFQASADIGLENGWMAEKLNFDIDNSQLGNFLIDSATALVTQGISELFPDMKEVEEAIEAESAEETMQQEAADVTADEVLRVLLRIDHVELAVPGLYPLVKVSEQECGCKGICAESTPKPCVPHVRYDKTRTITVIRVVDTSVESEATPADPQTPCDIAKIVRGVAKEKGLDQVDVKVEEDPTGGKKIVLILEPGVAVDDEATLETDLLAAVGREMETQGCDDVAVVSLEIIELAEPESP